MDLQQYLDERINLLLEKIDEYNSLAKEPQAGGGEYWKLMARDCLIRHNELIKTQEFIRNEVEGS
ncbi:hypothetical protein [Roseivirga pacifica]|uniref:hypothetical protein n=1 Tax=Roseivirga pacifica TaxID=1267423 RepID=UPI0020944AB7|nr:hypothetical protein [Roseivirga pacifica]MCO6358564.1 hypothetical protein [Roseivirga pacifica]MCO6366640.1 hypothetical protein [Roseivirga pacifica]MCO6369304.1 hypothetical protein [Roseivirga pacifica]MCO6374308.1 hypothetical protein [Roseivirga pacifica]MCO6378496.1 hypothetical protein [Roseivirga pacifica]